MHVFLKKEKYNGLTAFNLLVILCFAFSGGTSRFFRVTAQTSTLSAVKQDHLPRSPQQARNLLLNLTMPTKVRRVFVFGAFFNVKGSTFNDGFRTNVHQHVKRLKEGVFQGPSLVELTQKGQNRKREGAELRST